MTVDFREVDQAFCQGQELTAIWKGGELVWKKRSSDVGDVLFYAKDGALCKYRVSELSSMVIDYGSVKFTQPLAVLSIDYTKQSIEDMPKPCFQDDPHLSAVQIIVADDGQICSDTPVLSVIDDNPGILSVIPTYGFAFCKDLQYIRAVGVKEIGQYAFIMEGL